MWRSLGYCKVKTIVGVLKFSLCLLFVAYIIFSLTLKPRHQTFNVEPRQVNTSYLVFNFTQTKQFQTNVYRPPRTRTIYPITQSRDFLLNNVSVCDGVGQVSVLFVVHSAFDHFERRDNIRCTFASRRRYLPREVRVVFLLGTSAKGHLQGEVIKEHRQYGDIIQGDFRDSYHNLTNKGVMGLRWIVENCPHVNYVVKLDDDVVFDTHLFFAAMFHQYRHVHKTMWCNVCYKSSIYRTGKWKVKADQFKGYKRWPWKYCAGIVVVMTTDLIRALYYSSLASPFFWVDDVYLFGVLPNKIGGVDFKSLPQNSSLQTIYSAGVACLHKGRACPVMAVGAKTGSEFKEIWKLMEHRRNEISK